MEKLNMRQINWENTAKNLQQLRCGNPNLRRYVCWYLRTESGECDGEDCQNCRYDMDNSISQKELAEVFYVNENTIANWENKRSIPSLENLLFYSDICKVDLIGGVVILDE